MVEETERFFDALEAGDTDTLERISPDLSLEGRTARRLQEFLIPHERRINVTGAEVDGREAVVTVALERPDGGAGTGGGNSRGTGGGEARGGTEASPGEAQTVLLVPLRWDGERWVVEPSISVEQRLDFVPVE
ncbi:MAG: hypothetical protein ACOC45_01085 [Alkalispirochaetaceae bacterium]